MTIYNLPEKYREAERRTFKAPSECSEAWFEIEEALDGDQQPDHIIALAKLCKEHKAEVDKYRKRAKAIVDLAMRHEDFIAVMEAQLRTLLDDWALGDTVDDATVSVKLVHNPPSVKIVLEDEVPSQLMRTVPEHREPDKAAIKRQLLQGEDVPGVMLVQSSRLKY